jgi:membrane protein YqaA with SNARE-associated domain
MSLSAETPVDPDAHPPSDKSTLAGLLLRWMLALGTLLVLAFLLGRWFRPELEGMGRSFVERYGLWGMAFGTLIADGVHFPVPPQFYMLMSIASGGPQLGAFVTVTTASLAGGCVAYSLAGVLGGVPWLAKKLARSSRVVTELYARHGYRVVLIASLTPIAFSALCYASGLCHLPKRAFLLVALLRIPKLAAYYYLVRLGWGQP